MTCPRTSRRPCVGTGTVSVARERRPLRVRTLKPGRSRVVVVALTPRQRTRLARGPRATIRVLITSAGRRADRSFTVELPAAKS